MKLYNNIDLVQFNIKQGVDEYYFPKNVNWRNRVVDKVVLVYAEAGTTQLSPIDGQTALLDSSQIGSCYLDIYASDDTQIFRNMSVENFIYQQNHIPTIGKQLSLNLSRLFFTDTPLVDGCLLMYVFYGTKDAEYYPAQKSVTVEFELPANGKVSLQDIMDNYILNQPETLKGIEFWDGTFYLTLRDKDQTRSMNDMHCYLFRPQILGNGTPETQLHEFRTDDLRIDFLNSFVQNALNGIMQCRLTFNY